MVTGKKFIVAYDGSADSKKALALATDLAKACMAKILLVSVSSNAPTAVAEGMDYGWVTIDSEKFYTGKAEAGKKYCEEKGIEVHTEVLQGSPAEEIIKYAKQENADMIIAGTRGLGGFARLLLGSVAHQLVAYSDIPVLIVK